MAQSVAKNGDQQGLFRSAFIQKMKFGMRKTIRGIQWK
jgi:hypothetical protein